MRTPSTNCRLGLIVAGALALSACQPPTDDDQHALDTDWPTGLIAPIEGATFSMAEPHLPGARREYRDGTHQGFDFLNGRSGRPLVDDEPIVAIAAGEIVRIDHEFEAPRPARQAYFSQMANEPGFVGKFALDQLRGRQVWIRHEEGHVSRYAHLSEVHPELNPGDAVEQGQIIGLMGNTGIPATDDQPEPAPHLHFELWSPDGNSYLGQDLTPLDSHRAIATLFSEAALPRYARRVVSQVEAGQEPPEQYPPDPLPDTGFNVEPPDQVTAGNTFAIPIVWEADEFEPDDFFALLNGQPIGIIDAGDGVWALGVAALDSVGQELELVVGATDPYGQTLIGGRELEVATPSELPVPREVPSEVFARHTGEHRETETRRLQQVALQSLAQIQPYWQEAFHAPVDGDVVSHFGQRIFQGMLRPQYPNPGLTIETQADAPVLASNNGIVALAEALPIRGNTVAVIHGGGVVSVYANLAEIMVEVGDELPRGHQLGTAGTNAETDIPETRWEIQVAGTPSDPLDWLERVLPGR